jgi:hypothetical protein
MINGIFSSLCFKISYYVYEGEPWIWIYICVLWSASGGWDKGNVLMYFWDLDLYVGSFGFASYACISSQKYTYTTFLSVWQNLL